MECASEYRNHPQKHGLTDNAHTDFSAGKRGLLSIDHSKTNTHPRMCIPTFDGQFWSKRCAKKGDCGSYIFANVCVFVSCFRIIPPRCKCAYTSFLCVQTSVRVTKREELECKGTGSILKHFLKGKQIPEDCHAFFFNSLTLWQCHKGKALRCTSLLLVRWFVDRVWKEIFQAQETAVQGAKFLSIPNK